MPIVDVRPVVAVSHKLPANAAQTLADAIACVLRAEPALVWIRITELPHEKYAENGASVRDSELPVFVQILHADWPDEGAMAKEAAALAEAVAFSLGRHAEHVHIEYSPPGRGRIAFGGKLVR
jgi:phenylpyruvate tautomerase PptA (4-oxalocrotonate tautomerase family)